MTQEETKTIAQYNTFQNKVYLLIFLLIIFGLVTSKIHYDAVISERIYIAPQKETSLISPLTVLDKNLYDKKLLHLANHPAPKVVASGTIQRATTTYIWPVKTGYPNYGALLPFNRIVAYYGNFYSTRMGILGEFTPSIVTSKLRNEVQRWQIADPSTPVIPAIHYIAAVAQVDKGSDGDYLARMPWGEIDKALNMARDMNGILFLDIQIAHSNALRETLALEKYLSLPEVHLGVDPEFAMKGDRKPGTVMGTLDAKDINQVIEALAKIVRDNHLPPKILVIHRFTKDMVTNYKNIKTVPEVQIVMGMDGWGTPESKISTYKQVVYKEPVQFTGFKLFYKNDLRKPSTRMLTPQEILKLEPRPIYIQYQ